MSVGHSTTPVVNRFLDGKASLDDLRKAWADDALTVIDYARVFPVLLDRIDRWRSEGHKHLVSVAPTTETPPRSVRWVGSNELIKVLRESMRQGFLVVVYVSDSSPNHSLEGVVTTMDNETITLVSGTTSGTTVETGSDHIINLAAIIMVIPMRDCFPVLPERRRL